MAKKVETSSIISLIRAGFNLTQMSKKLGISIEAVRKRIAKLKLQKRVKQVSRCPALFVEITDRRAETLVQNSGGYNFNQRATKDNPLRVAEPHRFGFTYLLKKGRVKGGVSWKFRGGVARKWLEADFSIQAYAHRIVFWLKNFKGITPEEQIELGRRALRVRAGRFAREQRVVLEFEKENGVREWAVPRGEASDLLIRGLGLRDKQVNLGDVDALTDRSHPERMEFKDARGAIAGSSDEFAKSLELMRQVMPQLVTLLPDLAEIAKQKDNMKELSVLISELKKPIKKFDWRDRL